MGPKKDAELNKYMLTENSWIRTDSLPCVSLRFGYVSKDVSEGIGNYSSELRHSSDTFHSKRFACACLAICKYCSCWNRKKVNDSPNFIIKLLYMDDLSQMMRSEWWTFSH